jgi:perosamine synthetase
MVDRVSERERGYVAQVLDNCFRSSVGSEMTGRLERAWAEAFGARYAVAFVNGTATLHAALVAAGVGAGDEVIIPPLTMSSTAFAVVQAGADPVFADVDPRTFTIDPASVASRITPRTKAVISVSLFGLPADMDPLLALARDHNLFLLDDAAQCVLGSYKGRLVGGIADASSFSLQSSKHLTAGEGGMVTTDDEDLADAMRRFGGLGYRSLAAGQAKITKDTIQDPAYLRHSSIGFNYRMPELCAAVALAQVERVDELVSVRLHSAQLYNDALAGCPWLTPQLVPDGYRHSYWTTALVLDTDIGITWSAFRATFLKHGGEPFYACWQLSYLEPAFHRRRLSETQEQVFDRGLCPQAERLQPRLVQLKTNFFDPDSAARQAEALRSTVAEFDLRH